MTEKKLDTLVEDIYACLSPLGRGEAIKVSDEAIDNFGDLMKQALKDWLTPRGNRKPSLRMSNIGRPERQLWYDMNTTKESKGIPPAVLIKFLFGHLTEPLLLFFTELAGHKVTDIQKEVIVNGIVGHMDCKIDGEVVDIKTASGFAFKKFKNGSLVEDDPFGYISQLTGYENNEGTSDGGFFVMNKEAGDLVLFRPDELDKPNIPVKIERLKEIIKAKNPPDFCYKPVPEGTSGNFRLPRQCKYCSHKFVCHKDSNDGQGLRAFKYSKGVTYLTTVVRTPKVEEFLDA
tara:strand:+ start:2660 stop:3526 length:867 start_codon:yes stop_codon:yes gene_type:complete